MSLWVWAWVGVMVAGVGKEAHGFNFLPSYPQIFKGPPGAQFGFSVALWNDLNGVKRVVVGAPRANQTHWGSPTLPLGNVYHCTPNYNYTSGGGGGGGGEGCVAQQGFNLPSNGEDFLKDEYTNSLLKYGVGMGQTVTVERGGQRRLAACAPRYPMVYKEIKKEDTPNEVESHRVANNGLCFFISDLQSNLESKDPFKNPTFYNSLLGFSASFVEENNGVDVRFISGAPNAYSGCGLIYNQPVEGSDKSQYINKFGRDKKTTMQYSDTLKACTDICEGWAVTVGAFSGKEKGLMISASSPKFGRSTGRISFYPLKMKRWDNPLHTITEVGVKMGAMYGYAMATADVDGDGASDLLVGAPFSPGDHFKHVDVGEVYVYYAPLALQNVPTPSKEVIKGGHPKGQFGSSVAALGDLDLDGYEDVAVGAPYGGEDGGGAVFIYNGGEGGLRSNMPKVISASEFSPGARGFGFSIDGGVDMDNNGYPDIVIGAVHSDTAVLLRSSPVIKLRGSVFFASPSIVVEENPCEIDLPGQKRMRVVCFDLTVNFTYTSNATFDNLKLVFHLQLDHKNGGDGTPYYGFRHNTAKTATMERLVNRGNNYSPWSLSVFIQRARSNVNLTLLASASVSYDTAAAPPPGSTSPSEMPPVLDRFSPSIFNDSTILVCNNEYTCFTKPDLALFAFPGAPVILGKKPTTVEVNITLEVRNDPAYGIKVRVGHPENLQLIRVAGEALLPECRRVPHQDAVTCTFNEVNADEKIDFLLVFTYEMETLTQYLASHSSSGLQFSMNVKNDVDSDTDPSNNQARVVLEVKTKSTLFPEAFSEPETVSVTVNQTASDQEIKLLEGKVNSEFPVARLGPRFTHIFSLTNRGPSAVHEAKLVFHVPLYLGEERLTYFMAQPTPSPHVTCSPLHVNPLGLEPPQTPVHTTTTTSSSSIYFSKTTEAEEQRQRQKREVQDPSSSLTTDSSTSTSTSSYQWTTDPVEYFTTTYDPLQSTNFDKTAALECLSPKCLVACNVSDILAGQSVNVTFSSYLVTATVSKLGLSKVLIRTWIVPEVGQSGSTVINPRLPATTEILLRRPQEKGLFAVPLWVLILATVIALLLILIIILVLQKAGFFKRKRPPMAPKGESLLPPSL